MRTKRTSAQVAQERTVDLGSGVALEAEAILEGVQRIEGMLDGALFRRIYILGEKQFSPPGHKCSLGDDNPLS
ncbi:MAG TPA: hypothetical protein VEI99_03415 [Terriglobales bacterium]|nr:hypothetical protein [Terriglobales bacterium]